MTATRDDHQDAPRGVPRSSTPAPPSDPDTARMLAVAAGDLEQLTALFAGHHRRLFQYLCRQLSDATLAEDLTSEVFARVLRYRTTFRGEAPFGAWLFQLTRNVVADHFRGPAPRAAREVAVEVADQAAPHPRWRGADRPDPLAALEQSDRLRCLRRALAALPADKRELLLLARFETLPYTDIAALLGCTVGTVKVRVHRALAALRTTYLAASSPTGRATAGRLPLPPDGE